MNQFGPPSPRSSCDHAQTKQATAKKARGKTHNIYTYELHVCLYVYKYYIYIYIYMYARNYGMYVHAYAYAHTYLHIRVRAYMYVRTYWEPCNRGRPYAVNPLPTMS